MRIAIVNDVPLAVEAVRRVVFGAPGHELAWIARDGAQAVECCARDVPDLILMDLVMPKMDGAEATREIMTHNPCPIVIVTANVADSCSKVFEAMGAGALDAVNTPVVEHPEHLKGAQALLEKIQTIRRLISGKHSRPSLRNGLHPRSIHCESLVVIGASAGGPSALAKVLGALPADFPAGIVVIQHVDKHFAQGLATWLDCQVPMQVRLARDGDRPEPGVVLFAGQAEHLVFGSPTRLCYTTQPQSSVYHPSIDVFFKSAAHFWHGSLTAVLLTGMGRDGAQGLRALRHQGHHTIAQDQATSAVYGMPKAAAELDAAVEVLSLERIGQRLCFLAAKEKFHA